MTTPHVNAPSLEMARTDATAGFPPLARALLDALDHGVLVFDSAGNLLYANPPAREALRTTSDLRVRRGTALRAVFVAAGGRVVPLLSGPAVLGEAILLPRRPQTSLAELERQAILETLRSSDGQLSETARRLGISRTTLWRRLRAYGWRPGDSGRARARLEQGPRGLR